MRKTHSLLPILLASVTPCIVQAVGLPDTGQTLCDDGANNLVTCSNDNSGDASTTPRQDGRFGRDPAATVGGITKLGGGAAGFDYSKVANDGSTLAASASLGSSATDWACTKDNITGLIWEVKTTDDGLRDNEWTYSWYNSITTTNAGNAGTADGGDNCISTARCDTEKYVVDVNNTALCGFTDWRLPSKREQQTLIHFGASSPAIDDSYFPNSLSLNFWSSSSSVKTPSNAWGIHLGTGLGGSYDKAVSRYVQLVRGAQF